VRLYGFRTQLAAQSMDLHFDRVALDRVIPAVQGLFQPRSRNDGSRTAAQGQQERKFLRTDIDGLLAQRDGVPLSIDHE